MIKMHFLYDMYVYTRSIYIRISLNLDRGFFF